MRNQVGNSALAKLDALDLAELVLSLLVCYPVDGEAALGVVDQAEVLAGLLDGDDVHQSRGKGGVSADLAVDLDQTLHEDGVDLASVERILQAVAEEDDEREGVAELVRTGGGLGSVGTWRMLISLSPFPPPRLIAGIERTGQLVQEPVRGRAEALLVLHGSTRHFDCCVRLVVEGCRRSCRARGGRIGQNASLSPCVSRALAPRQG